MNLIESLLTKKLEDFQKVYSDIKFILFVFSLISILGFLIIYSFLYGYYFSGDVLFKVSNFNIISNFIPFDLRTLSMTSFYFICIFYIISGSITIFKNEKKNKKKMAFLFLILAVILNIMLTMFFASDITLKSISSFSLIWLFIGSIIWFLFILNNIILTPMIFVKSSILTFCFWVILSIPLREGVLLSSIMLIVLWMIITTLFILFKDKTWMIFLRYSPISFVILIILIKILSPLNIRLNVFLFSFLAIIAILFINLIIYNGVQFFKKRRNKDLAGEASKYDTENMDTREDTLIESNIEYNNEKGILSNTLFFLYRVIVYKKDRGLKMIFGIMILIVFVFTPQFSMYCGKVIRTFNISDEVHLEILYVNQNSVEESIFANYYIENNSVLYISNENWELEEIKPINYHIKPYKLNEE